MPSLKATNKNSFCVDRMHNEHEMEMLKTCLLLNLTFTIIFSVLPPGYCGTAEIIIFLPPQLRKADGKDQEPLLFLLVPTTETIFSILEAAAAGAIFPSSERTEGRNLTGAAVTLQHLTKKQKRTDSDAQFQPVF